MKAKEEFIEFLMNELSRVYCHNCKGNDNNAESDFCDDCHRKYMNWEISRNTAERIADKAAEVFSSQGTIELPDNIMSPEELIVAIEAQTPFIAARANNKRFVASLIYQLGRLLPKE